MAKSNHHGASVSAGGVAEEAGSGAGGAAAGNEGARGSAAGSEDEMELEEDGSEERGDGNMDVLLAAAASLAKGALERLATQELTRQQLWNLVAHADLQEGALSAEHCLGNAHKLMRPMVEEYAGGRGLMYDVFAVAVAYQLSELDAEHVGAPSFVLTPQEVCAWQEPVGKPVIGVSSEEAVAALDAIVGKGLDVLKEGKRVKLAEGGLKLEKVITTPRKRLTQGLQRLVTLCSVRAPSSTGQSDTLEAALRAVQTGFSKVCESVGKGESKGESKKNEEEDVDEMKSSQIEKLLADHARNVREHGENPLLKTDEVKQQLQVGCSAHVHVCSVLCVLTLHGLAGDFYPAHSEGAAVSGSDLRG